MRATRLVLLVFLAGLPAFPQPCEAPPEVKAAIAAAALPPGRASGDRIAEARKVRDAFPEDYYAHRFYQEQFFTNSLFSSAIQQEYKALLDAHPDDALYQMLYARTLLGTNTREVIAAMDRLIEKNPDFMLAHQKLTEVYSSPAFRDFDKLKIRLDAYWRLCPSSLTGYSLIGRIDDADFVRRAAANLRKNLESRTDDEALRSYLVLWPLEFKGVPLAEQEPVRERVRADAAKLRALDISGRPWLVSELNQAYRMLGDKEGLKWAEERMPKVAAAAPSSANAAMTAVSQWRRDHPVKPLEREVYQDVLIKQTEEWIKQWPDEPQVRYERFNALRSSDHAPLEDIVQAAEDWLRVYSERRGSPSPYIQVANFYLQSKIRYAEIPGLLEKALSEAPPLRPTAPAAPVSDLLLPAAAATGFSQNYGTLSTMNSIAGMYIRIRKLDRARELLARTGPPLMEAVKATPEPQKRNIASIEYTFWNSMAQLARLEGRKQDALDADRSALFGYETSLPSGAPEYMKTNLRAEYKDLNGSEEGFETWAANPAKPAPPPPAAPKPVASTGSVAVAGPAAGWTTLNKPLPDFEISDARGKTWRLADLKGKVTLINLWATWCGPCIAELPYLQKLHDKLGARSDLAVLTLNTDENPGLILPFMADHKFTFPVVPADAYIHKLVPQLSIPRNWIVDADGVLRTENIGFGTGDDKWVDRMIAAMEKAREPR